MLDFRAEEAFVQSVELENLIYEVPDPAADQDALVALRDLADPAAQQFARRLHTQREWRHSPLRDLLPGLSIVDSSSFARQLNVRAANALADVDVCTWSALADMTPADLLFVSGIGAGTAEEILVAAAGQWAAAYLHSADGSAEDLADGEKIPRQAAKHERLVELIGYEPDPVADRQLLLALQNPEDPDTRSLLRTLRTDNDFQFRPLRELLPGIGLVPALAFSNQLSVRAVNCLARARTTTLPSLAGMSPDSIFGLPDVGLRSGEEILGAVVNDWASAYLRQAESSSPHSLLENESLAIPDGFDDGQSDSLSDAFAEVERMPSFKVLRRRRLDADTSTQLEVAAELGVSTQRVSKAEREIQAKLSRQLRNDKWPISVVVGEIRQRLGTVARPAELEELVAAIDPGRQALAENMPHRLALLLWLDGYRLSAQWLLDSEIESMTRAILNAQTEDGPGDLDAIERQLVRLGVRKDLQLAWIASQSEFRIVDGKLTKIAAE